MSSKNTELGFGAIQALIVLVAVVVVVGVVGLVAHQHTTKTTPAAAPVATVPAAVTAANAVYGKAAEKFVGDFYTAYMANVGADQTALVTASATPYFLSQYQNTTSKDLVTCGSGAATAKTAGYTISSSDSNPTVKVTEAYSTPLTLSVHVERLRGALKISTVTCK